MFIFVDIIVLCPIMLQILLHVSVVELVTVLYQKVMCNQKCSGRTQLCKEVLNDTWVSLPSWSEEYAISWNSKNTV